MPPSNFKEYLQLVYSRFIVAAGIAIGISEVVLVAMLVFLKWPAALYPQIISILGWLAIGGGGTMTLIIGFLGLGGPAKSFSMKFRDIEISTQGDD